MPPHVRAMLKSDIDRVYFIESTAHRSPWGHEILHDCVRVGYDCRVLERFEDSQLIDLVAYVICRSYDKTCHILNLCVIPTLQRKGYGRLLLQQVIDSLSPVITDTILLEVRPSNHAALHLYQTMGFEQVGVKRGYYRDGPGIEDAIVLQKRLWSV